MLLLHCKLSKFNTSLIINSNYKGEKPSAIVADFTLGKYWAGTRGVMCSNNRSKLDISDVAREEIEQSEEEPGLFSEEVLDSDDLCCSCFSLCFRNGGGL